jgi:GT2 family glycosyltransferase
MTQHDINLVVLIPTYDRPSILKTTLSSWLNARGVKKIILLAQGSSADVLHRYEQVITDFANDDRLVCQYTTIKHGSIKARNLLLDIASEDYCDFVVLADDDYVLPDKNCLSEMAMALKNNASIGAIGGRVVVSGSREDPDFYMNLPFNGADVLSKLTGYIFLDVAHGPRYCEYFTPFMMIRKTILEKVRYDPLFHAPTGFREESDLQLQIKERGALILFNPKWYVIHLAIKIGGNRPKMTVATRIYWKARNNTLFIMKWHNSNLARSWFFVCSIFILTLYRLWALPMVFKGISDGIRWFNRTHLSRLDRN